MDHMPRLLLRSILRQAVRHCLITLLAFRPHPDDPLDVIIISSTSEWDRSNDRTSCVERNLGELGTQFTITRRVWKFVSGTRLKYIASVFMGENVDCM